MKIYLCGPINGKTDSECKDWRTEAKSKLPDTLDPMARDFRGKENESITEIVEGDKRDIDSCDALLVNFTGPSVGTSMEILYAYQLGKRVIVVNNYDKPISPWLKYHGEIVNSFDVAFEILKS